MRKTQWGLEGGVNLVRNKELNLATVYKALQNLLLATIHTHSLHNLVIYCIQSQEIVGSTGSLTDTSLCVILALQLEGIYQEKQDFPPSFAVKEFNNFDRKSLLPSPSHILEN